MRPPVFDETRQLFIIWLAICSLPLVAYGVMYLIAGLAARGIGYNPCEDWAQVKTVNQHMCVYIPTAKDKQTFIPIAQKNSLLVPAEKNIHRFDLYLSKTKTLPNGMVDVDMTEQGLLFYRRFYSTDLSEANCVEIPLERNTFTDKENYYVRLETDFTRGDFLSMVQWHGDQVRVSVENSPKACRRQP